MRIIVNTVKYNANRTAEQSNETMTPSLRELGGKVYFFWLLTGVSVFFCTSFPDSFPFALNSWLGYFFSWLAGLFFLVLNLNLPCLRLNVSVWVTVESTTVGLALEAVSVKEPSLGSLWWQKHPARGLFWRVSAGLLKQGLRCLNGIFRSYHLTCIKLSLLKTTCLQIRLTQS